LIQRKDALSSRARVALTSLALGEVNGPGRTLRNAPTGAVSD